MGHFSAMAGAVALAVIVIPVVVRTTEDMLLLVPTPLREAAAALGAPRVARDPPRSPYRAAQAGIVTGVLLAVARISGETAPLLFTALNNQFSSLNLNAPMASLPVVIFQFALSPYDDWQQLAWAGALIITVAVLALNIIARSPRSAEENVMNVRRSHQRSAEFLSRRCDATRPVLAEKIVDRATSTSSTATNRALKGINLPLYAEKVTAFIGPSGCGKSTLLRVLNRMYDLYPGPARRGRGAARRREHPRRRGRTSICCARRSAWCSRSRRRSRCRSTTTSPSASGSTSGCRKPSWTTASRRRCAARRSGTRSRTSCNANGPQPLRRPAAAAVHRPRHRGAARR